MPPSPCVFISFASPDIELAHLAVARLERAGIPCWIADRDITAGASYPAAITAAIKGSGAFLLLLTDAANASPHVLREVELAFTSRRPLLPVCIAGAKPSSDLQYFLSTSQWLDAGRTFDDTDLARIEPVLKDLLERGKSGRLGTGQSPWLWRGASIALITVAALVAFIWFRHEPEPSRSPAAAGATQPSTTPSPGIATQPAPPPAIPEPAAAATTPAATPLAEKPTVRATTKVNPRDGQTYVWIAPGSFVMGCSDGDTACADDEKPTHAVEITRGFWLARTEVTAGQFQKAAGKRAARAPGGVNMPVSELDWSEAKAYCARIGGRLPTESEWEYAARAGTRTRYYAALNGVAWFGDNSDDGPHPVATKLPNAFGLYDMLGNVSEWVLDRYYNAYDDTSDPLKPDQPLAGNASGVARGGSWTSEAKGVRVSRRLAMPPDAQEPHIGLRCATDRIPS